MGRVQADGLGRDLREDVQACLCRACLRFLLSTFLLPFFFLRVSLAPDQPTKPCLVPVDLNLKTNVRLHPFGNFFLLLSNSLMVDSSLTLLLFARLDSRSPKLEPRGRSRRKKKHNALPSKLVFLVPFTFPFSSSPMSVLLEALISFPFPLSPTLSLSLSLHELSFLLVFPCFFFCLLGYI